MKLKLETREITGKKTRTLRREGFVPAVIFGPAIPSTNVTLDGKDFRKKFIEAGHNKLIETEVDGKKTKVLIKEVQFNPVTRAIIHTSLYAVDMESELDAEIPVRVEGVSPAVKNNIGFLELLITEINVRCLPGNLPDQLTVDISKLEKPGDGITIGGIQLPEGVTLASSVSADTRVVAIAAPQKEIVEEEVVVAAEGEAAAAEGTEGAAATTEEAAE